MSSESSGPLVREQIISIYRQVLGREPSEPEIEEQLAGGATLDVLLRVTLDSEEYAERLRRHAADSALAPTVVNVFHRDLAQWGLPPGTRSENGTAVVGRNGWLFLSGGSNANLEQFVGAAELGRAWLDEWRAVVRHRSEESGRLGVESALLVVPEKLAVYEENYPEELARLGPRPIERLLADPEISIVYPLSELRAAASSEDVYIPTDTHLTFAGNALLFASVQAALGVKDPADLSGIPMDSYPVAGDLGINFDPAIVSVVSNPASLHDARVVEDNREEIAAVNGHIGTRRVFRNERAADGRVAVVFGDSFGFGATRYQGLSWFLAQTFREVHFVWVPFGWDSGYVRRVGAKAVLIQAAERFLTRVPRLEVDVLRLAEETLRRKQPLGLESAFD